MSDAEPICQKGEYYPGKIDPMLESIRQAIIDAPQGEDAMSRFPALAEFTQENVNIVPPDMEDAEINAKIDAAMAAADGLSLLLISGSGSNPDREAPGPRVALDLECQLHIATNLWPDGKPSALELVAGLARLLHHAQIRVSGFPWHEEIYFEGFDDEPDPDFLAYSIRFTRETQL